MVKMLVVVLVLGLLLVGSVSAYQSYKIPNLIPENYNCEEHHGFASVSTPFPFESSQHYVNRKNQAVKKQIEEVCD